MAAHNLDPWMSAKRVAVIIGIDYLNQSGELQGCRRDATNVYTRMVENNLFAKENIAFLVDGTSHASYSTPDLPVRMPTKANILKAFEWVVDLSNQSSSLETILLHYSGHGLYSRQGEEVATNAQLDADNEDDGRHEYLVPLDFARSGMIVDDDVNRLLARINPKVKCVALVDACHSETIFDLQYRYVANSKRIRHVEENSKCAVKCKCIMLSGCRDNQTSADAPIGAFGAYEGAMTNAWLKVLDDTHLNVSCYDLLQRMRAHLKNNKFTQVPQITCSEKLTRDTPFLDMIVASGCASRRNSKRKKLVSIQEDVQATPATHHRYHLRSRHQDASPQL